MKTKTSASTAALLVVLVTLTIPAAAYEVVLEPSIVSGPVSAPVTISIVWGEPGGLTPPVDRIEFHLEWDCQGFYVDETVSCAGEHGGVTYDLQSMSPQYFSDLSVLGTCLAITCECLAHVDIHADVIQRPPAGVRWPLAVFEFTREGWDITDRCAPRVFLTTVFRAECAGDPACDGGRTMTMVGFDVPVESTTWGRLKALMQSTR